MIVQIRKIFQIPRVGEHIKIDDVHFGFGLQQQPNKVTPDEAAASCHENTFHKSTSSRNNSFVEILFMENQGKRHYAGQ
jgi:hypothetical protein